MSKVMLIDPFCKNPRYESPNIKLGYCSSVLEHDRHFISIMDFIINDFEKIKTEDEFELIRQTFFNEIENKVVGNYQFVYINCEYGLLNTCMQIARRLKNRCKVILGGRFINYLHAANRLMKTPNIDLFTYISLGDPEKDLVNIINNVDQYIISKECNTIFYNSGLISDLDKIQMPKWFAFDLDKYDGKLYLVASKGCKYNKCTFCDERLIWGDTFRIRKLDEIVREIQFNMKHYNISEFFFWDASIASYPYIRSLCHAIIDKNINCSWTALVRADEITDELARLMKNAGCHTIEVGIETLSEESHKLLNKGETIDTIKRSIEILKSNNIKVEGSFLIGYIGDCETNILYTIEEAKNLHLDAYRWHNFEFPSTYLKYNDRILENGWAELDLNYPNQFLHKRIADNICGFLDMHIVSKMGLNKPEVYPEFSVGRMTLESIHDLTRLAIKETIDVSTMTGHNPYI